MLDQNLPLYRSFYAVANAGNISNAAEILFISQPAVSKSIKKLEQNMHCTLFVRDHNGVKLTEAGRILYQHVEKAFATLSLAKEDIKAELEAEAGHLIIGTNISLCRRYLMPYLDVFLKEDAKMRLKLTFLTAGETIDLLEKNKIDIGLIRSPGIPENIDFHSVGMFHDVFVANPSYFKYLGIKDISNTEEILAKGTLILLDQERTARKLIDDSIAKKGYTAKNILALNFMEMILDFAMLGQGIGCVVKEFVQEELDNGTLIEVPLDIKIKPREAGFVRLKEDLRNPATKKFWELLNS